MKPSDSLIRFRQLERIHQTDSRKCAVFTDSLEIRVLDVHAGDVVGQQHDFVAVQFVFVFVGQVGGLDLLHDADGEVAGADEGLENVDAFVAEGAAEFFLQNFLDTAHHEVDDGLRSINDAVGVGFFRRVALEEAHMDFVEELLFLGVSGRVFGVAALWLYRSGRRRLGTRCG